jgi:hypothetical protein
MAKKPTPFPEAHFQVFDKACHKTWNYINSDMPENVTRSVVMEMVLDAGRIRQHGTPDGMKREEWNTFYNTHFEPWVSANYGNTAFKAITKRVFPNNRY